jgi:hypothetical protein
MKTTFSSMARCDKCRNVAPTNKLTRCGRKSRYCHDCYADTLDASGVGDDAVAEAEADQREDDNR